MNLHLRVIIMKWRFSIMLTKKTIIRSALFTSVIVASMLASAGASAASTCKGLDVSACESSSSCRWVQEYQRKDGRKVNAFCRTYSAKANVSKSNKDRQKSKDVVSNKAPAKTLSSKLSPSKKVSASAKK